MSYTILIPARMHSKRLPDKPLKLLAGKPMIVRVVENVRGTSAERIVVATDHEAIFDACRQEGIECVMTRHDHRTGTDRLSEAVTKLGLPDDAVVVNVQGDEPMIPTSVVDRVAQLLVEHPECAIATAAHPIDDVDSFLNPNIVKVVLDGRGNALTFSRAPIPWPDGCESPKTLTALPEGCRPLHHMGLYAYRVGFLKKFPTLPRAPMEVAESLEQLRALYNGEKIAVTVLDESLPAGVDTAEDLERLQAAYLQEHA